MIMCVWGHHAYKNNKYLDVLCTPSDDVCHKFYSNYYRSTINILGKCTDDIYRSFVRIIFISYDISFIDKEENDPAPLYYHILFIAICV